MVFSLAFPNIDPVAVQIGPLLIRWYALAYLAGIFIGWWWCLRVAEQAPRILGRKVVDDFVLWATLGVVVGGRLGYVLFYKPVYYLDRPVEALSVWHGGMSFHGGAIGVAVAMLLFARFRKIAPLRLSDVVVCAVPIGLFFGRIANFVNGELWGRVTDVPWAVVFPAGGAVARHPSQLYEAILEGLVLFVILNVLERFTTIRQFPGALTGVFLIGYAVARTFAELFREPDVHIGFLVFGTTMGQWLSSPLLAGGLLLILHAFRREPLRA